MIANVGLLTLELTFRSIACGGLRVDVPCRARFSSQVNYNELELQFKSISSNFIG